MLYVDLMDIILNANFILLAVAACIMVFKVKAWKIYVPMIIVFIIVFIGFFRVDFRLWCVEHDIKTTKQDIEHAKEYCYNSLSDEDMLQCRIMLKKYGNQQMMLEKRKQWYLVQKFN